MHIIHKHARIPIYIFVECRQCDGGSIIIVLSVHFNVYTYFQNSIPLLFTFLSIFVCCDICIYIDACVYTYKLSHTEHILYRSVFVG